MLNKTLKSFGWFCGAVVILFLGIKAVEVLENDIAQHRKYQARQAMQKTVIEIGNPVYQLSSLRVK